MEEFDVIIVGSGLGGLECGAILSREGHKVLVLEKNKQIGGNLQIFARNKRIFDTGVHYIGGLAKGENLYKYLKFIGIMDDLKLRKLDEDCFDVITFDDDPVAYRYAQGYGNFIESLVAQFPDERKAIEAYCAKIQEACQAFPMYQVVYTNEPIENLEYLTTNARDFIDSLTENLKLRKVLAGNNGLYAGEGNRTPFYVHALVLNSYIQSSWRCVDGGAQIARLLAKIIKANGGIILNHANVQKFIFEDDQLVAVGLADGRQFRGKQFISNIHPNLTIDMVGEGRLRKAYTSRIKSLEHSPSTFIVYLSLKKDTVPYFNHNYYHFKDSDVWNGGAYTQWPPSYAVFTSASSKSPNYAEVLIIMAYMHFSETKEWEESHNTVASKASRGESYEIFKREKADILIDEVAKKFPGLRDHIEGIHTSTPLTYRDYIGTVDGSIYGISKDYKNPMRTFLSPQTKIPNLLLTGQNLNMHGVLGVTISAISTCSIILGKEYLMNKVIASNQCHFD